MLSKSLIEIKHNAMCAEDPKCQHLALDIRQPVYLDQVEVDDAAHSNGTLNYHQVGEHQGGQEPPTTLDSSYMPDSISLAFPPLLASFEQFQVQEMGIAG